MKDDYAVAALAIAIIYAVHTRDKRRNRRKAEKLQADVAAIKAGTYKMNKSA